MKYYYIIFCILLASKIYAQSSDFQISRDYAPSTFLKSDPKLYPNPEGGGIVTWLDYREGEPAYYAQIYDTTIKPIGNNFNISSELQYYFSKNYYIGLNSESSDLDYTGDSYLYISAYIYNNNNEQIKKINLTSAMIPWCWTGYLGTQSDIITTDSNFIFFFRNNGNVATARYDYDGNIISSHSNYSDTCLPTSASVISEGINIKGNSLISWFNADHKKLPFAFYGNILNSKDSVIIKNKYLFSYDGDSNRIGDGNFPDLRVKTVSDSLFEIFYVSIDSLQLNYVTYDDSCNLIGNKHVMKIPHYVSQEINTYFLLNKLYITPTINGKFGIFISVTTQSPSIQKTINTIFYFDKNGNIAGEPIIDSTQNMNFSNGAALMSIPDEFIVSNTNQSDIYIDYYKNFSLVDSQKVNDEKYGSNQLNLFVQCAGENKFLSAWQDEIGLKGRFIDDAGNYLSDIFELPGSRFEFFKDGSSIALIQNNSANINASITLSLFDKSMALVHRDTLGWNNDYALNADVKIISDSIIIVIFHSNDEIKLASFNRNLMKINEIVLPGNCSYYLKLFPENTDSIWVFWYSKIQLYSNILKPLSQAFNLVYPAIPLGKNNFLYISTTGYSAPYTYTGIILTHSSDTVKNNIILAYQADELTVYNIPSVTSSISSSEFIVVFRLKNNIYARVFSINGEPLYDSLVINSDYSLLKNLPSFASDGKKAVFTWSDTRIPGNGYDIYGHIWDISKLTAIHESRGRTIPGEFILYQNYPNPFNPATIISYSIPVSCHVNLKLYDILGREVATLVDEGKSPGKYEIEFDGSKIISRNFAGGGCSSGIYLYRIQAGNFSQTKKLIYLK